MARTLSLPFPPLLIIDHDDLITWHEVEKRAANRLMDGVSICLRRSSGPEKRGGYFFHLRATNDGIELFTFDHHLVHIFRDGDTAALFINHASGRSYDSTMWELSQTLNLRTDEQTN